MYAIYPICLLLLLTLATVVTLDLATRSMEYLLLPVFETSIAVFFAVFLVVFLLPQQRWFWLGHSDAQQQQEKSLILPHLWAAWFAFAESKFSS
jgi:hypothetical protein